MADAGFAIASHYLLMTEGQRKIVLQIETTGFGTTSPVDFSDDIRCLVTTEKGWLQAKTLIFSANSPSSGAFQLSIEIAETDPPITPYVAKTHGHAFQTDLPILQVQLVQDANQVYAYEPLRASRR